jgi:hypothetical protein
MLQAKQSIFFTSHTTILHRGHQVEIWNAALWSIYELLGLSPWREPISHLAAQCEALYDSTTVKINICGGVG